MILLGIETSCDETSAAVVVGNKKTQRVNVAANIVASSVVFHAKTGGIIPEIAAREQLKYIIPVIDSALNTSGIRYEQIDAIGVTVGPGLIGSLLVGVESAKTLAAVWQKPIIPVNHLYGHIYANWLDMVNEIPLPAIALVVSGGHTDLVLLSRHGQITWISGTRDDAAGEAFDKIGRLLGLPYPAGPVIEEHAQLGNPEKYHFPRPLLYEKTLDFSFSGLKSAALREVQKIQTLTTEICNNISRATQDAIIEVLVTKTLQAAAAHSVSTILFSGGVAANATLTEAMQRTIEKKQLEYSFFVPPKKYCTDNAAMIAAAAFYNYHEEPWENINANPELYFH